MNLPINFIALTKDEEPDNILDLVSVSSSESEPEMEEDEEDSSYFYEEENPFNFLKDAIAKRIWTILVDFQPYPGDESARNLLKYPGTRFILTRRPAGMYEIFDQVQDFPTNIHVGLLASHMFSLGKWYAEKCACRIEGMNPSECTMNWLHKHHYIEGRVGHIPVATTKAYHSDNSVVRIADTKRFKVLGATEAPRLVRIQDEILEIVFEVPEICLENGNFNLAAWYDAQIRAPIIELVDQVSYVDEDFFGTAAIQVDRNEYPALQRNAVRIKNDRRILPKPVVVRMEVNGQPV